MKGLSLLLRFFSSTRGTRRAALSFSLFFFFSSERKYSVRTVCRADRRGITDAAVRTEGTPPPSVLIL